VGFDHVMLSEDAATVHDELDSTSDEAARQISAGRRAPFVIVARRQTKGRGQRGASWVSLEGNLHMTLALPPGIVEPNERSLLPQKCGVLVARWFRRELGVPLSLKWPNDLMIGLSKCGGLLCESSFQGAVMGPVLVGIGINLASSPPQAARLADVGPPSFTLPKAEEITQRLAQDILASWAGLKAEHVPEAFEELVSPAGCWWQRFDVGAPSGDVQRMRAVDLDGSLIFENGTRIQTAAHEWRPLFMDQRLPCVTADVGNTRTKVVIWGAEQEVWSQAGQEAGKSAHALTAALVDALVPMLPKHLQRKKLEAYPVWLVGVNPEREREFDEALAAVGLRCEKLPRSRVFTQGTYDPLGHDRLAMMEAWAFAQTRAARAAADPLPEMILSCGTAATLDQMDGQTLRHLGGWIMPGLRTSLRAMHESTGLLPLATELSREVAPGLCTEDAMTHGVALQLAGAVLAACDLAKANAKNPASHRVTVTGGDARLAREVLACVGVTAVHVPSLVSMGALVLAGLFHLCPDVNPVKGQ
jgi:biotin-[acetyl-CoA-carboxylase] ligase BirA-like protein